MKCLLLEVFLIVLPGQSLLFSSHLRAFSQRQLPWRANLKTSVLMGSLKLRASQLT